MRRKKEQPGGEMALRIAADGIEHLSPLPEAPGGMVVLYRADGAAVLCASGPFGERYGAVSGKPLLEALPEALWEELRERIALLSPQRPSNRFVWRLADGGAVTWHEWRNRGFFDDQGRPRVILSEVREIAKPDTAIQGVRELDAFYQLLIEDTRDVVYFTDQNGIIRYISDTVEKVSGWKPEEAEGSHYMSFIHPDDMMSHIEYMKTTLRGGPIRGIVTRIRTRGGDYQYARIASRLVTLDGRPEGVVGIISHAPDNVGNEYQILRMLLHLLSKNERTVLMLMADGKSRRSIARSLDTVPEAVDTYCRRIRKKLGTDDISPIIEMIRIYPRDYFNA
ncbi:MAG: PAS domain S-box protein [Spirochaetes bacterium]|nr:PAS domain S-box protein [Spirochaetota bacterium]